MVDAILLHAAHAAPLANALRDALSDMLVVTCQVADAPISVGAGIVCVGLVTGAPKGEFVERRILDLVNADDRVGVILALPAAQAGLAADARPMEIVSVSGGDAQQDAAALRAGLSAAKAHKASAGKKQKRKVSAPAPNLAAPVLSGRAQKAVTPQASPTPSTTPPAPTAHQVRTPAPTQAAPPPPPPPPPAAPQLHRPAPPPSVAPPQQAAPPPLRRESLAKLVSDPAVEKPEEFTPAHAMRARRFGFAAGIGLGVVVMLGLIGVYLKQHQIAAPERLPPDATSPQAVFSQRPASAPALEEAPVPQVAPPPEQQSAPELENVLRGRLEAPADANDDATP